MNPAIQLLRELIREELQLGWSHLEDDRDDMASHHLCNAIEKVEQIKNLRRADALAEDEARDHALESNPTPAVTDRTLHHEDYRS